MSAPRAISALACFTIAASAWACSSSSYGDGPTATPPNTPHTKTVQALPSIAFSPSTVTVAVGDTIAFAFGSVPHNVFFDAAAGAPANIPTGTSNAVVSRVFTVAGQYPYTCHIHPGMSGTVVVTATP
jgi:plastocyanin